MEKSYTYVMSDIHGRYDTFVEMLKRIKFKDSDKLYIIGDVVDRGPKSVDILFHIMAAKNIVLLSGNHEYMAVLCLNYLLKEISNNSTDKLSDDVIIDFFSEWSMNGGDTTLQELLTLNKKDINRIFEFLISLKLYKELEINDKKFILVHAGLGNFNKNKKLKDYNITELIWDRMDYDKTYFDDKYIITGHTPTQLIENNKKPGYIYINNNNIAIDCGCTFKDGRLGCLRLDDMKEYYI